ncbi:glycosyltransferase family 2 protein [Litorimonas sp. RW-G-Af-16]|uniref:glycosyltransferase family 2 protein n=1 Tax=Litorimonas sp. RW-G-Af-16 TaxID=3241168 RepID=UPI00390CC144
MDGLSATSEDRVFNVEARAIPHISVIIVNYNGGEWLARSVQSVVDQTYADFECFIVDNGSTDGSLDTLPPLDARFKIIEAGENLGFAKGNNLAAKQAAGEWLALLNPDAFAYQDWLEKLLAATRIRPNVTMVGSTQYMASGGVFDGLGDEYHAFGLAWRAGFGHPIYDATTRECFAPCGAGAFYHAPTFHRLGGFDESFFCYHEDVDLGFRMRLDGGICVQSAEAKIDHISSGISGRASEFSVYHGTRNRIWTFRKNMPHALAIPLFPFFLATNLFVLTWSVFRKGRFAPTFRGMRDGFAAKALIRKSPRTAKRRDIVQALGWNPIKVYRRLPVQTNPIIPK